MKKIKIPLSTIFPILFSFILNSGPVHLFSQTLPEDPFYYKLLEEGKFAFKEENWKEAIENLKIASFGFLDNKTLLTECYIYLALSYYNLKDIESVKFYVNEIEKLEPSDLFKENLISKELVSRYQEVVYFISRLNPQQRLPSSREDEIKILKESIKSNPGDILNYYKLSHLYIESNKLKEALELWKHFSKLDPSNGFPYLEIAKIHRRNGEHRKALENLEKASAFLPSSNPEVPYEKGIIYFETGDFQNSYREFERVKKINESFKDIKKYLTSLNQIFESRRKQAEAFYKSASSQSNVSAKIALLEKALELDPLNKEYNMELAKALITNKKLEKAASILENYLKAEPEAIEIILYLTEILIIDKSYNRALLNLSRAEKIDSSRIEIPYLKGKIYFLQKRYREAMEELINVIEKDARYRDAKQLYEISQRMISLK